MTGKFRGGFNPFSRGCGSNCCYALCGPQFASLAQPAKYLGRKPHRYNFSMGGVAHHHHPGHIAAGSVVHVSDITSPDQVKVYLNSSAGGGHLKGNGTGLAASYNKVTI